MHSNMGVITNNTQPVIISKFSASQYLHRRLTQLAPTYPASTGGDRNENPRVIVAAKVVVVDHCIVRPLFVGGATLHGPENMAPQTKHCRKHYGFMANSPFREGIDPEPKAFTWVRDEPKFRARPMSWFTVKVIKGLTYQ